MNIKETEKITGISKQNIRFYESNGLLKPKRNQDNNYREYDENDVILLNKIKLLRKLDFSITEISHMIQSNEIKDVESHINLLKEKLEEYNSMISVCEILKNEDDFDKLDYGKYLGLIEQREKNGNKFNAFLDDFKKYDKYERLKEFTFFPDNMCVTKEEFTDSLLKFAKGKKLDIIITKESSSPEFTIDGIPYTATRYTGRFGAYCICKIKDESYLPKLKVSQKKKILFKFLSSVLPMLLIFIIISIPMLVSSAPLWLKLLLVLGELSVFLAYTVIYSKNVLN